MTTPTHHSYRHSGEHHERQGSRSSCNSAVIEDAAILKVVPLSSTPNHSELSSESPISTVTKTGASSSGAKRPLKSVNPNPSSKHNHLSGRSTEGSGSRLGDQPTTPDSGSANTSWADLSGSHDNGGGRPAWAVMPANGEMKNGTASHKHTPSTGHAQSKISGGLSDSHHIIPIKTHPEQAQPFHQHGSQERGHMPAKPVPHTPSRARHTPVAKRNSSEGHPPPVQGALMELPGSRHKSPILVGNRTESANWTPSKHDLHQQSTLTVVKTHPNAPPQAQHIVQRVPPQYPVVNGGLKPPAGAQGGQLRGNVLAGYSGTRFVNHRMEPVAVTCFNCGKRGHKGMTCPANTMETNDPDSELCLV